VKGVFWIKADPHLSLAIVLCPRGGKWLPPALVALQRAGVETIVSLLEKEEELWLGLAEEGPMAEQLGMEFLSLPLPDHSVPPDAIVLRTFVAGLAERLREGERIAVHCFGSIGRATVTAACTLIHLGWTPKAALLAIQMARGLAVPDTPEQQEWILSYRATL
jgi:protein-tyrosine phosphatase